MKNNDKSWKVVKKEKYNSDQHLLGFFNCEKHARDNIPFLLRKYGNWIKSADEMLVKPVEPMMIQNPVCTDFMHYVRSLIPNSEYERVMVSDASAEISCDDLMCGGATYYNLSRMIPKGWTVIDVGCAYNAQSYLFQDYKRHIAIEPEWKNKDFHFEYFKAPDTELLFTTGQKFITDVLPTLNLDLKKTFAICNYVPQAMSVWKWYVARSLIVSVTTRHR